MGGKKRNGPNRCSVDSHNAPGLAEFCQLGGVGGGAWDTKQHPQMRAEKKKNVDAKEQARWNTECVCVCVWSQLSLFTTVGGEKLSVSHRKTLLFSNTVIRSSVCSSDDLEDLL